jgi:hypothetical protein
MNQQFWIMKKKLKSVENLKSKVLKIWKKLTSWIELQAPTPTRKMHKGKYQSR